MGRITVDGKERVEVDDLTVNGSLQFGADADGAWRLKKSGNNLAQERKETGTWNEKSAATP